MRSLSALEIFELLSGPRQGPLKRLRVKAGRFNSVATSAHQQLP